MTPDAAAPVDVLAAALGIAEIGCWATGARHPASQDDEQHRRDAQTLAAALDRAGYVIVPAGEREACSYCGSRNGESPPGAWLNDPLTGDAVRAAIAEACSLTNPRLSEVDWDDVAAMLPTTETAELRATLLREAGR